MKLNLTKNNLIILCSVFAGYIALDITLALLVYRKNPQAVSVFFDTTSLQDKLICITIAFVVVYTFLKVIN